MVWWIGSLIFSSWFLLKLLYWWQVKEYRWDRLWSWIHYDGGLNQIVALNFRRPIWTNRARNIFITSVGGYLLFGILVGPIGAALGVGMGFVFGSWWTVILVKRAEVRDVVRARGILDQVQPKIVAITGSFGKSTSKDLLADLLSKKYRVVKTQGSENTLLGIARRIITDVKPSTEVLVLEMGAYKRGEIAKMCKLAQPDIAWITAIGNQHLDLFGGLDNLKKAKFEIVENLKPGGIAIFNQVAGEEDLIAWSKKLKIKSIIYSVTGKEANIRGALEIAKLFGVKDAKIALPKMEPIITPSGIKVLDSSHNTNQQAFEANITYLKNNFQGRKFVVSPGIIELGAARESVHQDLQGKMEDLTGVWIGQYSGIKEVLKSGDTVLIEGRVPTTVKNQILKL